MPAYTTVAQCSAAIEEMQVTLAGAQEALLLLTNLLAVKFPNDIPKAPADE